MDITEYSKNADFEWAVQLNRFSLQPVGLWPQKTSLRQKLNSNLQFFVTIVIIICVLLTPSLHSLINVWGDIIGIIDNIMFTLPVLTIPIKMLIMWWKEEELSQLLTMIAHDWIKSKSRNERDVMIRRAQNARLIVGCSYIITIATVTILIILSGLGYNLRHVTNVTYTNRPLPFQAHYVYNTSVSPQYEITFLIQCISFVIVLLPFIGIDNFLGFLLFHICGQLENLTNRLCQMRETKDFTAALKINVMDHVRIIRFVEIIEDTFTFMLLIMFLYFGILFCVFGFLLTIMFEEINLSYKRATFLILATDTIFFHMCMYCAIGELLMAKNEEVYNAIYECEWYTLETKEAKNLMFLMVRTNKPFYITAGKLLPMTMSTFCRILKTSGGYISFLLANQN